MTQQQERPLSSRARRRLEKRRREALPPSDGPAALPPHDGPGAVSPPLRWARRFTPLGIGRRRVFLQTDGGRLWVVRTPLFGPERVVAEGFADEFHSLAPSRGGRGLHLWHGDRLFRLVGRSTAADDGDSSPWSLGDDPVSAVIGIILLPVYLFALLGLYTARVASERENVATTLRWLAPVLGAPPPGLPVRPPLPGGWLALGRWGLRLAVLGGLVAGLVALSR